MKTLQIFKRIAIYLAGLLIIAVGINLSKLSGLGISPVSSIPGVLSAKFEKASLGSMVIVVYCALVLLQVLVLRRKFQVKNTLGIPVAIVFGLMVDFVGISKFQITLSGISIGLEREFSGLLTFLPQPSNYGFSLLYLLASILVIGIGVTVYLSPKLVPMPAEGLAGAISQVTGKKFGNCKTIVDVSMITVALILQILLLGKFSVVREGTVFSAVCVGQVVKYLRKILQKSAGKDDGKQN